MSFKIIRRQCIILFLFALCCSGLFAQSAMPTTGALFDTRMINYEGRNGTMFPINVGNREYWLTAKHILTGRPTEPAGRVTEKSVRLAVLNPVGESIQWEQVDFTVIDPGNNIDIVILVPKSPLSAVPLPPLKLGKSFMFGGECSFLGFPYSNTWTGSFGTTVYKMPFIKHCYISGITKLGGVRVLVLDGINNHGFSGGPVLYKTGPNQVIIGVIGGFYSTKGEVRSVEVPEVPTSVQGARGKTANKMKKENVVELNTGIIYAFMSSEVLDAIKKDPIGQPLQK